MEMVLLVVMVISSFIFQHWKRIIEEAVLMSEQGDGIVGMVGP